MKQGGENQSRSHRDPQSSKSLSHAEAIERVSGLEYYHPAEYEIRIGGKTKGKVKVLKEYGQNCPPLHSLTFNK